MHLLYSEIHAESSRQIKPAKYIYGLGGIAREIADIFSRVNQDIAGFVKVFRRGKMPHQQKSHD